MTEEELSRRTTRLEQLTKQFGDPFRVTQFPKTHDALAIKEKYATLSGGEKTTDRVSVAGRIMAIRNGGMFIVILDDTDRLQIFHDIKQIPVERAQLLELLDLGDIIGVTGLVRRTPRGEITIDAEELQVLSKALEPPPPLAARWRNLSSRITARSICRYTYASRPNCI